MMWDPRNYSDTDFGLEERESFEPAELSDLEIDVFTQPHIMTVLGPIDPEDLGICLPIEHVLIDPPGAATDQQLNDSFHAIEELTSFVTAGGKAVVDTTTLRQGRDIVGLFDVARRVPVHVICSTSADLGIDRMLDELRNGIGPRKIRPGVIQSEDDAASLASASHVSNTIGLPIFVKTRLANLPLIPADAPAYATIVLDRELPDEDAIAKLIESGYRVAFAGIGTSPARYHAALAKSLVSIASAGHGDKLIISQRLDRRSNAQAWGGQPGLVYLLERFTLELMEAGAGAAFVRQLLVDNPAQALTIHPDVST